MSFPKSPLFLPALFLSLLFSLSLASCSSESSVSEEGAASAGGISEPADKNTGNNPEGGSAGAQSAPLPSANEELQLFGMHPRGPTSTLTQVVAVFNQPMVALGDYDSADPKAFILDPPLSGKTAWLNQYALAFTLDEPLYGSLALNAKLDKSRLRSLTGKTLSADAETTVILPPLQASAAYQDYYLVDPVEADKRPVWIVVLNQKADLSALNAGSFFVCQDDEGNESRVEALWAQKEEGPSSNNYLSVFQVTPEKDIPKDVSYRLVIAAGTAPQKGLDPAPEDITLGEGRTHGILYAELRIQASDEERRERRIVDPQADSVAVAFTNPVKLREALPFIDVSPRHPGFEKMKQSYARLKNAPGGAAKAENGAGGAGNAKGSGDDAALDSAPNLEAESGDDSGAKAEAESGKKADDDSDAKTGAESDELADGDSRSRSEDGEGEDPEELYGEISQNIFIWPAFQPESSYEVTLKAGLPDVFGETLFEDKTFTFTTTAFQPRVSFDMSPGTMERDGPHILPATHLNKDRTALKGWALDEERAVALFARSSLSLDSRNYHWNVKEEELRSAGVLTAVPDVETELKAGSPSAAGPVTSLANLDELFGGEIPGKILYLTLPEEENASPLTLEITNIGLTAKIGGERSLVWITGLKEGRSLSGATVKIWSYDGSLLFSKTTDENGLAVFPGGAEILKRLANKGGGEEEDSPFNRSNLFVTASYEGDLALWNLNWDQKFALWNYNLGYSDSAQAMSSPPGESWLMSAQQVYKPGETLRLKIISRIERDGVLEDFQGPEGRLVILDPAGQVFLDKNYPVSPFGSLDVEEPIPADAPYGYYSFYLDRRPDLERDARELHPYVSPDCDILGSVGVLAYRTPPFEISFPSLPENPLGGDKETIEAVARYHYGAPAAGLQSFHTVLSEPFLDFGFPAWSGYAFTDYFSFQSDAEAGAEYGERGLETVLEGSGTLDSQGKISFPLELPPDKVPIPRTYSVSVSAYDLDSRHVSAYKSFTAHPSAVYVGIKTGAYLVAAGEDSPGIEADLIVTDLKGELLTGRRVKVALKRRFWTTTRRKAAGGVYEYVSKFTDEPVSETELESADQPVKYQALPPKAGFYILSAETLDDRGLPNRAAVSFYAFGGAESGGWRYENDDSINLVSDKTEYSPGDVAKIMIQSPFSEGVGLLTTERGGVREARVFKVESQSPVVEVPISEKDFPNVYVSILLVRGRVAAAPDKNNVDLGKPSFRMGYRKLKVKSRASILLVEAQAAKKEYAPGDEVEIDVSVRDHEGNPFADLELAVAVVDAGVVQLSGDEGFYPEKLFSRERPVAVETVTNIANVIGRRDWANKGGGAPGGGGGAPGPDDGDVRRDFRSVPFYQGKVEVSADGKARVKFKLPDNTTTFKIYALATGHGALTGTGSGEFLVTKDFLLRSSLPRYATLGDRFSAGVTVANRTEKAGEARVEFSATGLKLDGDEKVKNVSVPAGGGSEVFFKVVAVGGADESQSPLAPEASPAGDDGAPKGASPSDPSAKALFQADMGNMVDKAEFGLPLREAGELIVQAAYNEVSSETLEVEILLPPEADRDPLRAERSGTGLKVDLYPSLIPLLKAPLKYLETYPYDCLEQSTSKAFAALSALKLGPRLDIDPEDGERLKRLVERHISNLVVWQLGGGFVYWPKNPDWGARSPYLTSYVLLFLKEAEAEGFRVDPDLVGYVREYLSDAYAELSRETDPRLRRDDERLFVLLALTRSGSDTASELELFFLRKDELDLYGLSLLTRTAAALAPSPNRAVFLKELVPLLANDLEISAGRASVKSALGRPEFFLYGKDDLNAQILLALVEAEPDFHLIPSLARAVTASARSEDFGNTYRAAALLSAVSRYAQLKEPEDMNVDYGAVYAGKEILKGVFKSAGDKPVSAFLKPGELSTGRAPLVFSASGKGSLWSRAELSYRLKEPDLSPLTQNGLVLSRVYQVIRPEAEKPGESVFKRGQVLRVTVTLLTHVERRNLVLEDKIPAGFEAVDFNLRDADRTLLSQVANPDSAGGYSNWYDHREDGPDKVALFADYLPPGVYEYSYLARPVTPGTFLVEGPAAHEMYAPENRGRGAGLTVTVEEPQSAAAKDPGTENEAEAGSGTETEAGSGAETEAGSGTETEAGSGAETEAGSGTETEAGSGTETEAGSDGESGKEASAASRG